MKVAICSPHNKTTQNTQKTAAQQRVLHLPHLCGCIIPSASNSRPDWGTVEAVTPVQRANWGSDWNWMSAVTGSLRSVGGWCHSWRPPLQERTICSPHATGIQSSRRVISAAHRDKMSGNLSERRGRQSGGVFSFSLLRREEGNNAHFIIANRRNEIRGKRRGGGGVGEKAAAFKFGLEFQHYHFIPRQLCSPQTYPH